MKIFFSFLLLLISQFVAAQAIDVTGVVQDVEGQPLHFAFVKDVQTKTAVYTDSIGNFAIKASGHSSLYINCFGYRDTVVNIADRNTFVIILRATVNISASKVTLREPTSKGDAAVQQLSAAMIRDGNPGPGDARATAPQTFVVPDSPPPAPGQKPITVQVHGVAFDAAQGAMFPQFNPKEETVGSRYFLKGWIHGFVINSKDSVIQAPTYLFAYDKLGGGLLLTKNEKSAIEVDREIIKSFTLYDNNNTPYTFENVPTINTNHYVQVLASGDKYKIYKNIKTTFEKDNFASDGVMSSGHNYDQYVDVPTYYIYDVQTNALQKVALKKKAIKEAFAKDADKWNKFMTDHSSDTIDDFYLSVLGSYMNE